MSGALASPPTVTLSPQQTIRTGAPDFSLASVRGTRPGVLAVTLALAQSQGARVKWYALRDGFASFRQFIERPASLRESYKLISDEKKRDETYDREIPYQYFAFDVLRHFDLPQVLAAAKAKGLVVNPIDGDWNRMPIEEAKKLLPHGVRTVSSENPDDEIRRFLSGL